MERAQALRLINSAAPAVEGVPESEIPALRDALDEMPLRSRSADVVELQFLRQFAGALELHCKHLAAENARLQEENQAARNLIAITLSGGSIRVGVKS